MQEDKRTIPTKVIKRLFLGVAQLLSFGCRDHFPDFWYQLGRATGLGLPGLKGFLEFGQRPTNTHVIFRRIRLGGSLRQLESVRPLGAPRRVGKRQRRWIDVKNGYATKVTKGMALFSVP